MFISSVEIFIDNSRSYSLGDFLNKNYYKTILICPEIYTVLGTVDHNVPDKFKLYQKHHLDAVVLIHTHIYTHVRTCTHIFTHMSGKIKVITPLLIQLNKHIRKIDISSNRLGIMSTIKCYS